MLRGTLAVTICTEDGMARRSGLISTLAQMQREADRRRAAELRAQAAALREAERARSAYERAQVASEKERQHLYQESRLAETHAANESLERQTAHLEALLADGLKLDQAIDFASLRKVFHARAFIPGALGETEPLPREDQYLPGEPAGLSRHLPHVRHRHEADLEAGRAAYASACAEHAAREQLRQERLESAQRQYREGQRAEQARIDEHNAQIDAFEQAYRSGDPAAITNYIALVLDSSYYPESFPRHSRLAYVPESRQLVIELELPSIDVVPEVATYKYVKARDEIAPTARSVSQRRQLYGSVVAQMALRTLHEAFRSDSAGHIDTVVLNGHVSAIDPGTGQPIRPCLVSLRVTNEVFDELDLARVDPIACLKALGAGVSKSPAELAPVRPVLEFSMVDPRFVEEQDILTELDQRPNLMELTPSEFESLITNLFQKMGLETKLTQASRDGGVDCVAYDPRPVLGGKVVIQAKRYKNTVGVSAVRDLFGTMHNEGATKGILVTTSGYGKAAFDFAANKPLELLDGSNLLYLLAEHAGIEAKIEPPEDWVDAGADSRVTDL